MSSMPPPPPPPPPPPGYMPYSAVPLANRAGFGARLGGYLIDSILYGLILSIFVVPAIVMGVKSFDDCRRFTDSDGVRQIRCRAGELNGGLLAGGIIFGLVGVVVVAIIYLRALGRTGQTWGRKMVGVKVVDATSGEPLGIGRAIGRQLAEMFLSGNCVLGYLWMLWDKDRQTWHDKIIGSVVIRT